MESSSTVHHSSPLPSRHAYNKLSKHILQVPDGSSSISINTTFGNLVSDQPEQNKRIVRPRRVLSSIASSSDDHKSQTMLNKIRESKSLDSLPVIRCRERGISNQLLQFLKRSTRSLENCDKCGNFKIFAIPENKFVNNNFPNGNVVNVEHDDTRSVKEDVEEPLLHNTIINPTIVHRRKIGNGTEDSIEDKVSKKWKSLETEPGCEDHMSAIINKKNLTPRPSIRSWIVGLFNGNRIRSSHSSLRKGVLPEYNNLKTEKESIV